MGFKRDNPALSSTTLENIVLALLQVYALKINLSSGPLTKVRCRSVA